MSAKYSFPLERYPVSDSNLDFYESDYGKYVLKLIKKRVNRIKREKEDKK